MRATAQDSEEGEEGDDEDEDYEEEEDDDDEMQLPPAVMRRVLALKELQDKRTAIFDEYKVSSAA